MDKRDSTQEKQHHPTSQPFSEIETFTLILAARNLQRDLEYRVKLGKELTSNPEMGDKDAIEIKSDVENYITLLETITDILKKLVSDDEIIDDILLLDKDSISKAHDKKRMSDNFWEDK